MEYKMITTVAIVRNIDHSSTKVTYNLEDRTGTINAHLWVEEGDAPMGANMMLNTYARVIGAIRHTGDAKSIMIYKIQPVKGINEVNTHFIEVVNARYQAEEYYRGGDGKSDGVKMEVDAGFGDATQSTNGTQSDGPKGKELVVFKAIQQAVALYPEHGVNRTELRSKFPHISENELGSILEKLLSDGHVYSTLDADHFMSCF
jgi:replication factor A2